MKPKLPTIGQTVIMAITGSLLLAFWWALPLRPRFVLDAEPKLVMCGFSPSSEAMVTCRFREDKLVGPVEVWETRSGNRHRMYFDRKSLAKAPYFLPDGKLVIEPLSADAVEIEVEKGRPPFPVHADGITLAEQVKEKGAIISYHRPWVLTLDFTRGIHIG